MLKNTKKIHIKIVKGLLDFIILQFLSVEPMHGYQLIIKLRKTFGTYFGPSTIYPLLITLEESGCVKSEWNMKNERPRKVYNLTPDGVRRLKFTEDSFNLICKKLDTSKIAKDVLIEDKSYKSIMRKNKTFNSLSI